MSRRINLVRTTAFRLTDEQFGKVHVYRPGSTFTRVWNNLERQWRQDGDTTDFRNLPYRGLAAALRVLTGDFVALERRAGDGRAFVISRTPIPPARLATAIGAWESRALGLQARPVSRVVSDLHHEEVEVARYIERRPGLCPSISEGWVWDVGVWDVARQLAASPMRTDSGAIRLRLDSDAALLSWDDLVQVPETDAAAMHKLTLHLITVPGVEDPVLSVQASLVRLTPTWKARGGVKYAWASLDPSAPILRGRVRRRMTGDALATDWDDRASHVLDGASLDPLPRPEAALSLDGDLRAGYSRQPSSHRIGRGVGTWFHECVAHHVRETLEPAATPLTLTTRKVPTGLKKKSARMPLGGGSTEEGAELSIVVIYHDTNTRRRVRDALAHVLADQAHPEDATRVKSFQEDLRELNDNTELRCGPISVRFLRPNDAELLVKRSPQAAIVQWADSWLPHLHASASTVGAIVETDVSASDHPRRKDGLADPKQVLRGHLAAHGIVTQFITADSAPTTKRKAKPTEKQKFTEHAAANGVGDLLRSTGYFLRPFPEFGCGEDALVVGVYGARLTRATTRRGVAYVVNLVAVAPGTRAAWGYIDGQGWVPIGEATAAFLSTSQENGREEARALVERAVEGLYGRFGGRPVALLFDAFGCRRFWPCLADKSDLQPEAWMTSHGKAVVRVRTATSEVLRPAGAHEWTDKLEPALHTPFRLMSLNEGEGSSPTYVLSGSGVMSREISARESTRFAAKPRALKADWHSLGVTELQVLDPGPWKSENLLRQVAIFCRIAPTWDRTLRWPSPLHLARAVVRDHPHGYFNQGEEDEDVEDNKKLRLDFGIR